MWFLVGIAAFCNNQHSTQFFARSCSKLGYYTLLSSTVLFHKQDICGFPSLIDDLSRIGFGVLRKRGTYYSNVYYKLITEQFPQNISTVKPRYYRYITEISRKNKARYSTIIVCIIFAQYCMCSGFCGKVIYFKMLLQF